MGSIKTKLRWLRVAKRQWRNRRFYKSGIDVAKAFYLQVLTPNEPPDKTRDGRGFWIHPSGLKHPVWLRRRDSDFLVFQEIFENGEYRPIKEWNLPSDSIVLDLGANVGLSAVYFASVLPEAKIVSVEPDHSNCESIRRSCSDLIASGKVQVVEAFVAAKDGSARIDRSTRSWAFRMASDSASVAEPDGTAAVADRVACVSIPTLMLQSGVTRIDLLKCDIEGSEAELFAHCQEWIGSVSHLIVETHAPYKIDQLIRQLDQANWAFDILGLLQEANVGLAFLRRRDAIAAAV